MEVLTLQVFVSLMLVVGSLVLFAFTCRQRDFEHADRLALSPLDDDDLHDGHDDAEDTKSHHAPKDAAP